jgi:hypothetical protein
VPQLMLAGFVDIGPLSHRTVPIATSAGMERLAGRVIVAIPTVFPDLNEHAALTGTPMHRPSNINTLHFSVTIRADLILVRQRDARSMATIRYSFETTSLLIPHHDARKFRLFDKTVDALVDAFEAFGSRPETDATATQF